MLVGHQIRWDGLTDSGEPGTPNHDIPSGSTSACHKN